MLAAASVRNTGATVFAYQVRDPERYGVVSFDEHGRPSGIVEKPKCPASNWAVTGLYFYDNNVVGYASEIRPSNRGELEITDLNLRYLRAGPLEVARMGRGFAWLDAGTFESLIDAASFVQTIEQRQGMKIACPEEIAYRMGFITRTQLRDLAHSLMKNGYGEYLARLVDNEWSSKNQFVATEARNGNLGSLPTNVREDKACRLRYRCRSRTGRPAICVSD